MIAVLIILQWLFKTTLYWYAFKYRKISTTLLGCITIAGASIAVMILPVPIPHIVQILFALGVTVFLTMHYTRVSLIPDGLIVPLAVEAVSYASIWGLALLYKN